MNRLFNFVKNNRIIILLSALLSAYFFGIFYSGMQLESPSLDWFVSLLSSDKQDVTSEIFKSANLPIYYFFKYTYLLFGKSNDITQLFYLLILTSLFGFFLYKINLNIYNNKEFAVAPIISLLSSTLILVPFFLFFHFIDHANSDAFSFVFIIASIYFWLKDNYIFSFLFAGLSFVSHPIYPTALLFSLSLWALFYFFKNNNNKERNKNHNKRYSIFIGNFSDIEKCS